MEKCKLFSCEKKNPTTNLENNLIALEVYYFATGAAAAGEKASEAGGAWLQQFAQQVSVLKSMCVRAVCSFCYFSLPGSNDFLTDFLTMLSLKMKFCCLNNKSSGSRLLCRTAASFFDKQAERKQYSVQ